MLNVPIRLLLVLALFATGPVLRAQSGVIPDRIGPTMAPITVDPGWVPEAATTVRGPMRPIEGEQPPIPPGPKMPQNDDRPGRDQAPNPWPEGAGVFKYFTNESLGVTSTDYVGSPSAAMMRDTAFQTGNSHAALSLNSGHDWQENSPSRFFPVLDGGYGGHQRVKYVRSHDIMVWLIQYSYSSRTGNGSYRIAVTRTREGLRSNDPAEWRSYVYTPQTFGFGSGHWLDYPDVAASNDWLHISANVYDQFGRFVDSVRWRLELVDLAAGAGASMTYSTGSGLTSGGKPSSLRFAEGGDGSSIYYAAFKDTTTLWIFRNSDASGGNVRWERTVNSWTNAKASCPGPDQLDWCGTVVGRLRGAFGDQNRIGFIWASAGNGGSRPQPYSRIATFDVNNNVNKLSDNDQWNSTLAFVYGAAASNSQNHIGIVFAVGGPSSYVHSSATIVDQYQTSFGGMTTVSSGSGNSGPEQNKWGDYFDVQRHPMNSNTFVGTGMRQRGGPKPAHNDPRFFWFGRDDYEPTDVNVSVQSTPITGVPITLDIKDVNGNQNGSTNFTRVFDPRQGCELTAPLTATSGSTTYVFERWAHKTTPTTSFSLKPLGDRVLTIADVGSIDDIAEARYLERRTLDVTSTNPSSGVAITVSVPDINGAQNGSTAFSRFYRDGQSVTLTAPAAVGFNPFKHWVLDGRQQAQGARAVTVTMTAASSARAEYYNNVGGSVRQLGAGCRGSVGVPVHTISYPSGQQGPQQGTPTTFQLSRAKANTFAVLHFGLDNRTWNGFQLPLSLSFIGMGNCVLYHDLVVSPGFATSATGTASLPVTLPVDPAGVGRSIYTTWAIVDIGANNLGVVHSNAMETVHGGNL